MPRSAYYEDFGPISNLKVGDVPSLPMGADTVAIDIAGAAINPVDYKIQLGYLAGALETHFPVVPGWDVAGTVTAVGPGVPEFVPGDKVFGYARLDVVGHGTIAESGVFPARVLAKAPESIDLATASAIPLTGLTAYQLLARLDIRPGETVLIHNASGGVGQFAVQLARLSGGRVIGTASSRNHEQLRILGADPVQYGDGLVAAVRELAPDGVDVVVDLVGGGALEDSDAVSRPTTRIGSIADGAGAFKRGGSYVFVRPSVPDLNVLADMVDDGSLSVDVADTYPLHEVVSAYERLAEGHVRGKIVITP